MTNFKAWQSVWVGVLCVLGATQSAHSAPPAKAAGGAPPKEAGRPDNGDAPPKASAAEKTKVRFAHFLLDEALPENSAAAGPFSDLQTDLHKVTGRLRRVAKDPGITGVVLSVQGVGVGLAGAVELRDAIAEVRAAKKRVHAQLESATTIDYLVASACDEVSMPESGLLVMPGVRLEPVFFRGLLDQWEVQADFIHMGEAKGAAEQFTNDRWSKPVKDNMSSLADDLYEQVVDLIATDRGLSAAEVRGAIDQGLLTAARAKELGLVDRVAYPDEVREGLERANPADRFVYVEHYGAKEVDTDFSGPAGVFKLMQLLAGSSPSGQAKKLPKVAIVYALGPIVTGRTESGLFGAESVGSTTLVEALDEAQRDDDVKAIVLRVDSPGGSAVASDAIWRKIRSVKKPVVASMGDTAASGGYYIAMGCDKVFAEPTTLTGSIGVVGGKLVFGDLLQRYGVTSDLVARGKNSGVFSQMKPFSVGEREAFQAVMQEIYAQFTSKAAEARRMPVDKLRALAEGRVYTGRQALRNGLVDHNGGLTEAIAEAKRLAGLAPDEEVTLEPLPKAEDFFEGLFSGAASEKEVGARGPLTAPPVAAALPRGVQRATREAWALARILEREAVAAMAPYAVEPR